MTVAPMAGTIAILPVKRFELAKTRLGAALPIAVRRSLARAMVADVLDALVAAPGLDAVAVVTNQSDVAAMARAAAAIVLADPHESGQSAAALIGIQRALADSSDRALLIPGDCPALDGATLDALLSHPAPAPSVAIVADRHGLGTNALLLSPPDVIAPGFGAGSFERHRLRAHAAGAAWHPLDLPGLAFDIDTPDDLDELRRSPAGAGARTRALLASL
jgi:2-phospho-L-lactate guanylyltransferase